MADLIYCLDSGTTVVKAAAITTDGKLVALQEVPNDALRRDGVRAEQDMAATRAAAWHTLQRCVAQTSGRACGLIITGQGEGVWPLGRGGEPLGDALTWLDGRSAQLVAELDRTGTLDAVAEVTGTLPTTASPSVQLLWLQRHDPERFQQIAHVLRSKEWIFFGLTGALVSEPSTAMLTWGDWRRQQLSDAVERQLGLRCGLAALPALKPIGDTVRPLAAAPAAATGLPQGLPVWLGPSDVQATAIGLGVGVLDGVNRASIFGTSAIHIGYFDDVARLPPKPRGAMLQSFVEAPAFLCVHAGFNGTTTLRHVQALLGGQGAGSQRALSGLVLHPFFEPGGERAPLTDPHARATLFGLRGTTDAAQVAWAAREALAFNARISHDMMGTDPGAVAFGGGLAADDAFAALLASVLQRRVLRTASPHAGLLGLGLMAAHHLGRAPLRELATRWLAGDPRIDAPDDGALARFLDRKYDLHVRLLERLAPLWPEVAALQAEADRLVLVEGGTAA